MRVIEDTAGESVHSGLLRAKNTIEVLKEDVCKYVHNDIHVLVNNGSHLYDLCTIYDLRRALANANRR